MTREFNVEEAADWDKDEAKLNLEYLETRGRLADADRVRELRGEEAEVGAGSEYDELTVEELQDELRARDLQVSGNKAELIQRLVESDEG